MNGEPEHLSIVKFLLAEIKALGACDPKENSVEDGDEDIQRQADEDDDERRKANQAGRQEAS